MLYRIYIGDCQQFVYTRELPTLKALYAWVAEMHGKPKARVYKFKWESKGNPTGSFELRVSGYHKLKYLKSGSQQPVLIVPLFHIV